MIASGEIDFGLNFARIGRLVTWMPACRSRRLAGVHSGCYELFAHEPIRTITRSEGQEGRHPDARLERAPVRGDHGGARRARPAAGHRLGHAARRAGRWSCSPTGKVDAFLGFPPEPQELRARKIGRVILNTATDKPWSQYFCCMLFGNRDFVRALSGRDQARPARHPQGHRHLRHRAGAGRATAGRWRLHAALRLRAPDADRAALRPLARVRPGGLAAVLRAAAPRGRHDQVEPQQDHRRGHRLALPERAQARAEGVSHCWRAFGLAMLT